MIKLKYLTLAFVILGLFVVLKVINFFLPVIIACIILYVVYITHMLIKRIECEILSTLKERNSERN